ncbi:PIG-L family deacetylase [Carboxydochorda subterranea]|uniref:PIG-L family deacetylase n=1 Tax=Carboxydichorda subterranea TaxID=3109565 RepID=A0ABZ1BXR9_9FIRM|nr:PIG-L family deacetylase [Limnochorda sp. L945t]WRP17605.1 PIG-L family deacetylase [Limnochorda sp. L945t]
MAKTQGEVLEAFAPASERGGPVDVLAIGAHPDDIELGAGGLLILARRKGLSTGGIVLTRGDAGRFGTEEQRRKEAAEAARVLELSHFEQLDHPDAALAATRQAAVQLALRLRKLRPRLILAPHPEDRHFDHQAASRLADEAAFLADRATFDPETAPLSRPALWWFGLDPATLHRPHLVVDITPVWAQKEAALRAHASQAPIVAGAELYARVYGAMIGVMFGEGFIPARPAAIQPDLSLL